MDHLSRWGIQHASQAQQTSVAERMVDEAFQSVRPLLIQAVLVFLAQPLSATSFWSFEFALIGLVRQLGRELLQAVVQALESIEYWSPPRDLEYQCGGFRRRSAVSRNANIGTLFGNIVLMRTGYRGWQAGEQTIFPLELMLGLCHNASPALLDLIGKTIASTGQSQQATLKIIEERCGVSMGVKRLRNCIEYLAEAMEPLRQAHQVEALLEVLGQAQLSSGNRKPVLSVGRDGITLRSHKHGFFEVATAATISVYDRAGKRLRTIYLAHPPEPGQATMDTMLSELLEELLRRWTGPLPRLAYVTDSGSNETDYYRRVLRKMKHPVTGRPLEWTRVADYYHVSERIWTMAHALFGKNQQQASAWAWRMLKELKRPCGASRVLHSAASLFHRRKLSEARQSDYHKAYRYIQKRTKHLQYHRYREQHIPLGSGVTEAACKTIYTQRLKLSGMAWSYDGAKRILTLRTVLLSGTWPSTYAAFLADYQSPKILAYAPKANFAHSNPKQIAA